MPPFSYAKHTNTGAAGRKILAGDVGATKTNLGLFEQAEQLQQVKEATFPTKDFPHINDMLKAFLGGTLPDSLCLGVAGPVENGKASMTNVEMEIDTYAIASAFNHAPVHIINDLEATGYGIAGLKENEIKVLKAGIQNNGNQAIIAPGTGLGEAGLYWDDVQHHPFATEGGHCDFFPRIEMDIQLLSYLQAQYGHVSWERVLSGPGIYNIYRFLVEVQKMEEPDWLAQKISAHDPAAVISEVAATNSAPVCTETIALFFRYLAQEAASLVLKVKATGGIYIGGGIVPKIEQLLETGSFIQQFCDVGRMKNLMQQVPVKLILNNKTALLGAARFAAFGRKK